MYSLNKSSSLLDSFYSPSLTLYLLVKFFKKNSQKKISRLS